MTEGFVISRADVGRLQLALDSIKVGLEVVSEQYAELARIIRESQPAED